MKSQPIRAAGSGAGGASWAWYSASSSCLEAMSVPTTEPADVPMITSAAARSMPSPVSPAIRPVSQAMPVTPPPPRTSARLSMTVIYTVERTPGPRTFWHYYLSAQHGSIEEACIRLVHGGVHGHQAARHT